MVLHKIDYRISGTFGELRGNHYHAGLDMGTAGVENIDVHAAADGWVSRVKVAPMAMAELCILIIRMVIQLSMVISMALHLKLIRWSAHANMH